MVCRTARTGSPHGSLSFLRTRIRTVRATTLAVLIAACGCPREESGTCDGSGAPELLLTPNHGDRVPLDDGSELAVFPPPQGGVFTELDVSLYGVREGELQELRLGAVDDGGATLMAQTYFGSGLPLQCRSDDALAVNGLPVAFAMEYALDELDGVAVTFTAEVITEMQTSTEAWAITLRATDY